MPQRLISVSEITDLIRKLSLEINTCLGEDVFLAIQQAYHLETSESARNILSILIENIKTARSESLPICQDTGIAVLFVEIGQDISFIGGNLRDAINEGVRQGYVEGYLRKSVLSDPLIRVNTGDNTPAIIHFDIVPGSSLKIKMSAKGGGSENSSVMKMMNPSEGEAGIRQFVLDAIKKAWANPCPPMILGIGIGGNFETAPLLAKKALFRKIGDHHPTPHLADLERLILQDVNGSGVGTEGFGGSITALAVNIEAAPCHIASLPVAINIDCHVSRHREITL